MNRLKCEKVTTNSLTAKMPEPPKAIESLLEEYQDFLDSVFAKEYQTKRYNPLGTAPIYFPKLTQEERSHIESLTRRLHCTPEWKEYTQQCKRWAVLM